MGRGEAFICEEEAFICEGEAFICEEEAFISSTLRPCVSVFSGRRGREGERERGREDGRANIQI